MEDELLLQFIEMDTGTQLDELPKSVRRVANAYERDLSRELPKLCAKYGCVVEPDELPHAAYLVLMTLRGEGVGVWDGDWDEYFPPRTDFRSMTRDLQGGPLSKYADVTGTGKLNEAIRDAGEGYAANRPRQLPPPAPSRGRNLPLPELRQVRPPPPRERTFDPAAPREVYSRPHHFAVNAKELMPNNGVGHPFLVSSMLRSGQISSKHARTLIGARSMAMAQSDRGGTATVHEAVEHQGHIDYREVARYENGREVGGHSRMAANASRRYTSTDDEVVAAARVLGAGLAAVLPEWKQMWLSDRDLRMETWTQPLKRDYYPVNFRLPSAAPGIKIPGSIIFAYFDDYTDEILRDGYKQLAAKKQVDALLRRAPSSDPLYGVVLEFSEYRDPADGEYHQRALLVRQ